MRRALIIGIACVMALFLAAPAFAASPTIDRLSVSVKVLPSTSLQVVEQQVVTLPADATDYTWNLYARERDGSVQAGTFVLSKVSIVALDESGAALGEPVALTYENPFDDVFVGPVALPAEPDEQAEDEPGEPTEGEPEADSGEAADAPEAEPESVPASFSFNRQSGAISCSFPDGLRSAAEPATEPAAESVAEPTVEQAADSSDEPAVSDSSPQDEAATPEPAPDDPPTDVTVLIRTEYVVVHCLDLYRDVAELNWRYVNTRLPYVQDANLTVTLPAPADALPVEPGDDVAAWGHGPDHGTFTVNPDATITYRVSGMPARNYAEAHIIFPVSWVNASRDPMKQHSEMHRASVMASEEHWVDEAVRNSLWDDHVRVLFLSIAVIAMLPGIVSVVRNGRSPRARKSLIRVSAALGIIALGELLFFHEPLTTVALAAMTLVVAAASLMLPLSETELSTEEEE